MKKFHALIALLLAVVILCATSDSPPKGGLSEPPHTHGYSVAKSDAVAVIVYLVIVIIILGVASYLMAEGAQSNGGEAAWK